MSLHPDAQNVLDRLDAWTDEHQRLCEEYADAVRTAAQARHDRDLAYSKALQHADGSSKDQREAVAYEATENEHAWLRRNEANVEALKRLIQAADRNIERWRSHNAAMGVSLRETASGRHA